MRQELSGLPGTEQKKKLSFPLITSGQEAAFGFTSHL